MRPNLFSNGRWYFPYPSSANGQTTAYFMSFADGTNLPFYISNFYSLMKHCAICDPHCCCYDSKWKNQSLVSTYFLDIFGRFSTHFLVVFGRFSGQTWSLFHVHVRLPPEAAVTISHLAGNKEYGDGNKEVVCSMQK